MGGSGFAVPQSVCARLNLCVELPKAHRHDHPPKHDKPDESEKPHKPYEPEKPHKPYEPEKPHKPYEPEKPHKPYEPEKPHKPYEPEKPHKPCEPEKPHKPCEPDRHPLPPRCDDFDDFDDFFERPPRLDRRAGCNCVCCRQKRARTLRCETLCAWLDDWTRKKIPEFPRGFFQFPHSTLI